MLDLTELARPGRAQKLVASAFGSRQHAFVRLCIALALLMSGALFAWVAATALKEQREAHQQEIELADWERRLAAASRIEAPAQTMADAQRRAFADAVDRINLPWAELLNDLERTTPASVAILQLEPEVASGSLRILVEAKSDQDLFRYLDELRDASALREVRLTKFETNTQDATRPVRFLMQAELGSLQRNPASSRIRTVAGPRPGQ